MEVVSLCPLRVASVPWQPRADAWSLAVVCKATYRLAPIESPLAEEQDDPNEADGYWNDDTSRSLHIATDLVPFKKRAEVVVTGHAYAPEGRPVPSLIARVVVGDVDKAVEIVADRAFTLDGQLVHGPPFTRMPLRWERAAGGPGTSNPIGLRADARPDVRGRVPLPNLQPPGTHVVRPADLIPTVGFGPIAPTWPDRWGRRQRVTEGWDHRAWQEQPLPPELDAAFFNVAPSDQQIDVIRSNERIVLENLHPEHPRLVTNLAGVSPSAEVDFGEGSPERFSLRCDTLWIDADRGTCSLTWRAQIPMSHPGCAGRVAISLAQRGAGSSTLAGSAPGRPLPFGRSGNTPPPPAPAPAPAPGPKRSPDTGGTVEMDITGAMPALPFRVGRSPLAGTVLGARPPPPTAPVEAPPVEAPPISVVYDDLDEVTRTSDSPLLSLLSKTQPFPEIPPPADPIPIARCAEIAAKVARRAGDARAVLDAHAITSAEFEAAERRWAEAVDAELLRGRRALLDAYDDAYVAALEAERGPLGPTDHARLAVAAERGVLPAALADLGLPRDAVIRIERVRLRRMLADPDLAKRSRLALSAARRES